MPNGYVIRTSVIRDKIGGYREDLKVEDLYIMLQIAKHAKLKYINKPLFNYRWHANNSIKLAHTIKGEREKIIEAEQEYALSHGYEKQLYKENSSGIPYILERCRKHTLEGRERSVKLFGITIHKKIKQV